MSDAGPPTLPAPSRRLGVLLGEGEHIGNAAERIARALAVPV